MPKGNVDLNPPSQMPPDDFIHAAFRFVRTIGYLTPRQMLTRVRRIANRNWNRAIRTRAPRPSHLKISPCKPLFQGLHDLGEQSGVAEIAATYTNRAAGIRSFKFDFLNQTIEMQNRHLWHDRSLSHLWRYHLHYFDYCEDLLVDFRQSGNPDNYAVFKTMAQSWMQANDKIYGDGWHPYTLSLRIVNWLHALDGFADPLSADQAFRMQLLVSIRGQLEELSRDLEHDVRGNHIIKNLRALLIGGGTFQDRHAQKWLDLALQLLQVEIDEQILPDGGHFERNPGYHLAVFKDLLECAVWLQRNRHVRYTWLDDGLRRMLGWLITVSQPENRLPLLKDTTLDSRQSIAELLAAGALYLQSPEFKLSEEFGLYPLLLFGREGQTLFESWKIHTHSPDSAALHASGFYLLRDDTTLDLLIFDAGRVCPDYLPAHAHADLLSFELTCSGTPIVVDSGVYEYTAGQWRDYFRSTRAHNTVELNGCNQSDVWGSFRMAARALPGEVVWDNQEDHVLVQASHDGYARAPHKAIHHRAAFWQKGRFWLILDRIVGERTNRTASHIHFHPVVQVEQEDADVWQLLNAPEPLWLTAFGHKRLGLCSGETAPRVQGWYSERFGNIMPNTVLTLHGEHARDVCLGYIISKENPVSVQHAITGNKSVAVTVVHGQAKFTHTFKFSAGLNA